MNIGIIGCGWLGLPLAIELKKKGVNVHGTSTDRNKLKLVAEQGIIATLYDGNPSSELPAWVGEIDALIINFPPSKSYDYPLQILKLIQHISTNCHVLFTSSTGVYLPSENPIDEEGAIDNAHLVYRAEMMVREQASRWTILRLAGLIAEDRNPAKYLSNRPCPNPDGAVNLVHRNDVIQAIIQSIEQKAVGKTFNVCAPQHPTRKEYYQEMTNKLGLPPPIFAELNEPGKCIDGNRITRELNISYQESVY